MALAAWPSAPEPWLQPWLIWRVRGTGTRPSGVPETIPPHGWELLQWCLWKRKGRPEPRPDVAATIPGWAFDVYAALNKAVPVTISTPAPDWLQPWCIWRFRNSPPELKPAGLPAAVTDAWPACWSVLNWMAWTRKGQPAPRPKNLPPVIPQWCWSMLRVVNAAVPPTPLPPPPPPPEPPAPPAPASSWTLSGPLWFTAHGWKDDSRFRDTDEALRLMRTAGGGTVALQIGQYQPNDPSRVRQHGMKVALWGEPDSRDAEALATARADAYIPQIEGPSQYQNAIQNLEAGVGRGLSLSTVTTFGGLQGTWVEPDLTAEVKRLRAAGCTHAWVEVYKQGGPSHFPISDMMWVAKHVGFVAANPVLGLYWDVPVGDYRPPEDPSSLGTFGKQVGAWLAETMRTPDWTDFGALGT